MVGTAEQAIGVDIFCAEPQTMPMSRFMVKTIGHITGFNIKK